MGITQAKYAQHAASGFRKAQKRGYKGSLASWLNVFFPTMADAIYDATAKRVAQYEAQANTFQQ